jgi:hypothetical protein
LVGDALVTGQLRVALLMAKMQLKYYEVLTMNTDHKTIEMITWSIVTDYSRESCKVVRV